MTAAETILHYRRLAFAARAERDAVAQDLAQMAARLAAVEAERGDLIDRLTVAKALHTPQPGQGTAYCRDCDQRWPCPTRAVLSAAPTDTPDLETP